MRVASDFDVRTIIIGGLTNRRIVSFGGCCGTPYTTEWVSLDRLYWLGLAMLMRISYYTVTPRWVAHDDVSEKVIVINFPKIPKRAVYVKRRLKGGGMRNVSAWLGSALFISGLLTAAADDSRAEGLVFLSTQLRPIEEAQMMRKVILKEFPREVDYVTEQPPQLPVRIKAEQQGGTHTIDVVGALHGELQPARAARHVGCRSTTLPAS